MQKVLIKSSAASFRRAGMEFTRDGVVVDVDALSDAQRAAIEGEPQISIGGVPEDRKSEAPVNVAPASEDDASPAKGRGRLPKKNSADK
jgi:hypothetical protein